MWICFRLAHDTRHLCCLRGRSPVNAQGTLLSDRNRVQGRRLALWPRLAQPASINDLRQVPEMALVKAYSLSLSPLHAPCCNEMLTPLLSAAHFFSRQQRARGVLRARFSYEVPQHTEGSAAGHHRRVSPCRTEEEPLAGTENGVQHPQRYVVLAPTPSMITSA